MNYSDIKNEDTCIAYLIQIGKVYHESSNCTGGYDGFMCWEAAAPNTTIYHHCANIEIFDTNQITSKECTAEGKWFTPRSNDNGKGYVNYDICLTSEGKKLQALHLIMEKTKVFGKIIDVVEYLGLILSILCILISLFIFFYHRVLRCKRTTIHINLFISILIQCSLKFFLLIDQFHEGGNDRIVTINLLPNIFAICQIMFSLLMFAETCVFTWMFVEGIYLNILLTYSIFDNNKRTLIIVFHLIGWGLPIILVGTWVTLMYIENGINEFCWINFDEQLLYYIIILGSRYTIIIVNLACLINVIRILFNKLNENNASEKAKLKQIRKSVRAAILLLPLLGITHVFYLFDPSTTDAVAHVLFRFFSTLSISFQGVYVSLLYCFLNNEVKNVIKRNWLSKIKLNRKLFKLKETYPISEINCREQQNLIDSETRNTQSNLKSNIISNTENTTV